MWLWNRQAVVPNDNEQFKLNFMLYNEIYNLIYREEVLQEPTVFNGIAHSNFWDMQKPSAQTNILRRLRSTDLRHILVLLEFTCVSYELLPQIFWRAIFFLSTQLHTALKATQELGKHERITVKNKIAIG